MRPVVVVRDLDCDRVALGYPQHRTGLVPILEEREHVADIAVDHLVIDGLDDQPDRSARLRQRHGGRASRRRGRAAKFKEFTAFHPRPLSIEDRYNYDYCARPQR